MRALRWTGRALLGLGMLCLLAWGALALVYAGPRPPWLAQALAAGWVVGGLGALLAVRPRRRGLVAFALLTALLFAWWSSLRPRNDRVWLPDVAQLPTVEIHGDVLTFHNVRNFDYRSETDYTPRWETRTYDLARLQGLDLFMSYWSGPTIAHTIMSWDFNDGQHLAISIETRKEVGEEYDAIAGFFRQYELYYVVADERDVIRLRTNYRHETVHLYQLRTPIERARKLLLNYIDSINGLVKQPEWYNAATTNCTTTIRTHVNAIGVVMPWDRRLLINGDLDELLYEQGAIDGSRPLAEVRAASIIDARAQAADQDPAFSARIREGMVRPPLRTP
ncbi:MAG TPA: DUF4105 domain-containing protein [Candidatus Binatia bacterium]|jgi:hypothetical protein